MSRSNFRNRVEAALARAAFGFFGVLPLDAASALGGWLGTAVGYRLPVTRRARRNLAAAYPDMSEAEREGVLKRMWNNLGRTTAEFPHIAKMKIGAGERIEIDGLEHLDAILTKTQPLIFFGAHCGNWELAGPVAGSRGIPLNIVYRAPNNPHLDWLFAERGNPGAEMIPKGSAGARTALRVLQQNKALAMLVDQKMNDGIAVPFFGRDAMTAPALAQFALKFRCPVIPAHTVRLNGARFRVVIEAPLVLPDSGDRHADLLAIMTEVNRRIETWVRAHPDQWLWVHKRWKN